MGFVLRHLLGGCTLVVGVRKDFVTRFHETVFKDESIGGGAGEPVVPLICWALTVRGLPKWGN